MSGNTERTEDWYRACYVISLEDKSSGGGKFKVFTSKAIWAAENPALVMMEKVRAFIKVKAVELGWELESLTAQVFMTQFCCFSSAKTLFSNCRRNGSCKVKGQMGLALSRRWER